jgi:hypothetical protein
MPFVAWHYRNGHYVRSHYRRLPWRRADASTPRLFAPTGAPADLQSVSGRARAAAPTHRTRQFVRRTARKS